MIDKELIEINRNANEKTYKQAEIIPSHYKINVGDFFIYQLCFSFRDSSCSLHGRQEMFEGPTKKTKISDNILYAIGIYKEGQKDEHKSTEIFRTIHSCPACNHETSSTWWRPQEPYHTPVNKEFGYIRLYKPQVVNQLAQSRWELI